MSRACRAPELFALGLLALLAPARAAAQEQSLWTPARVEVGALFGEGTLIGDGWAPIVVELENRTRTDQRGVVETRVSGYRGTSYRRADAIDVPAGQTRRLSFSVFGGSPGNTIVVRFDADGRVLGRAERSIDYAPSERSVVLLSDPPRLRGALLDLDVDTLAGGLPRRARFPVGTVRFDGASGDPLLPDGGAGWSTVGLLVASGPALARVGAAGREAIEDWLRAGGTLLVSPRSDADLRQPWLTALAGPMTRSEEMHVDPEWASPPGTRRLACETARAVPAGGCMTRVGFGRVLVAPYDLESGAAIEGGASRALVSAMLATSHDVAPALPFARGVEELDSRYWDEAGSFGTLRAALDPNQAFRPALVLVALVLLFYVVLVGPLNFGWVARQNRPVLALVTTPLVASGCVVVLLAVGYVGKGVVMRYRRVEVLEALEGEPRALARRYTGLYSTRPGTFDLPGPGPGEVVRHVGGGSGEGPVLRGAGASPRLTDFRAGLWETTFLREDRVLDLGGPIRFERSGARLVAVVNASTTPLAGAVVVDAGGSLYVVGDLAPGQRREIPTTAARSLDRHFLLGPDAEAPRTLAAVTGGADDADARARLRGVVHLLGGNLIPQGAPVLYARLAARREELGGTFAAEQDERWIRVQPTPEGPPPLARAPVLVDDGYGGVLAPGTPFEDEASELEEPALDAPLDGEGGP
ncbi:MAG: hypothetical protein KF729_21085 [Sandaracinaceae bacterium]|nr:hypothetical protein [Sandaracinaceae bacterium]